MSRAPHLVPRAQRMGHARLLDHMSYDGLEDPESGELMGFFAEQCADRFRFTRQQQDAYAAESVRRSLAAIAEGRSAGRSSPSRSGQFESGFAGMAGHSSRNGPTASIS